MKGMFSESESVLDGQHEVIEGLSRDGRWRSRVVMSGCCDKHNWRFAALQEAQVSSGKAAVACSIGARQ